MNSKFRLIAVLLVLVGCFAEKAHAQYDEFIESVELVSTSLNGTYATYSSEKIPPIPLESRTQVWTGKNGKNIKTRVVKKKETEAGVKHTDTWSYRNNDYTFVVSGTWILADGERKFEKTTYNGHLNNKPGRRSGFVGLHFCRGKDAFSGLSWSEILTNTKTKIELRDEGKMTKLIAKLDGVGSYTFHFAESQPPRLKRVECLKSGSDLAIDDRYTVYEYDVEFDEYGVFGDLSYPKNIQLTLRYDRPATKRNAQRTVSSVSKFTVKSVEPLEDSLGEKIDLPSLDIVDGTAVRFHNDIGVPYEYQSGYLLRVVDDSAIVSSETARFREPRVKGYLWYGLLICALLIAGFVFYYKRK